MKSDAESNEKADENGQSDKASVMEHEPSSTVVKDAGDAGNDKDNIGTMEVSTEV